MFNIPFFLGMTSAFLLGVLIKILHGIRLNLFLVNADTGVHDQALIPLTAELKKASLKRTLLLKRWKEDVEITLADYHGKRFTFNIQYHLWNGFYLQPFENYDDAKLNKRALQTDEVYFLRNGMTLEVGDRKFSVHLSPAIPSQVMHPDLIPNTQEPESLHEGS